MAKIADVRFKGASGALYDFETYALDANFNNVSAIYIFVKRYENKEGGVDQKVIYVGQTIELGKRISNHDKLAEAKRQGATNISIHRVTGSKRLDYIEEGLIRNYQPACNIQLK